MSSTRVCHHPHVPLTRPLRSLHHHGGNFLIRNITTRQGRHLLQIFSHLQPPCRDCPPHPPAPTGGRGKSQTLSAETQTWQGSNKHCIALYCTSAFSRDLRGIQRDSPSHPPSSTQFSPQQSKDGHIIILILIIKRDVVSSPVLYSKCGLEDWRRLPPTPHRRPPCPGGSSSC